MNWRYTKLLRRGWNVLRTSLLWGWRLHHLGKRSILKRSLLVNNPRAVSIGSRVSILDHFILADLCPGQGDYPKIKIGDGCTILFRFQCNAARSVTIGQNVLIASNVFIGDSDHVVEPGGIPVTQNQKLVSRPTEIGSNCWIGQNAVILKGVKIGDHCIIGANSVVNRDVPPCSVVAGNPARVVKTLARSESAELCNVS